MSNKERAFKVSYMLLSYIVAVFAIVMVLEENISKPERIFYLFLWLFTCRIGDKIRKDLKEVENKNENLR